MSPDINSSATAKQPNEQSFVVTQDYIQESIKNALKQSNLNPEIEEKLLNLQRYQESQTKFNDDSDELNSPNLIKSNLGGGEIESIVGGITTTEVAYETTPIKNLRKRINKNNDNDDEWILERRKRRNLNQFHSTNEQFNSTSPIKPFIKNENIQSNRISSSSAIIKKEHEKKIT